MNVLIFAFSRQGYKKALEIEGKWKSDEKSISIKIIVKCRALKDVWEEKSIEGCISENIENTNVIVFVGAVGIAVRSIAPFVKHKSKDPAVVVIDETGKFCISLLSGHMGGGNELTDKIARMTGALPVITTATDREGKFAVDEFARKNNMFICDWNKAKRISAFILEGNCVNIDFNMPFKGSIPNELKRYEGCEMGIKISYYNEGVNENTLQVVPKVIGVGIGCRKNTDEKEIEYAILKCLEGENININSLFKVGSIDIKKNERGIIEFCKKRNLPFVTYSAERLNEVKGDFSKSEFVESVTGVSNVCERSAAAEGEKLICRKKVYGRVTVALSIKKAVINFE
ncbi:MAG: cobalamin biosynthesis protein [Clostridia bacterium]|nr:cobalamin biosynthesis protein [Clostridia bacterium]